MGGGGGGFGGFVEYTTEDSALFDLERLLRYIGYLDSSLEMEITEDIQGDYDQVVHSLKCFGLKVLKIGKNETQGRVRATSLRW